MNDGKVYSCQLILEQYTRKQIIEKCKSTKFVDKHFFRTYVVESSKNQLQPVRLARLQHIKRQTAIVPTSASLTYVTVKRMNGMNNPSLPEAILNIRNVQLCHLMAVQQQIWRVDLYGPPKGVI